MKRRDYIKVSTALGLGGLMGPGIPALAGNAAAGKEGFDLHPFIKAHPEAVFINLTTAGSEHDTGAIHDAAHKLAGEILVKNSDGSGYPGTARITCKPNWTCNRNSRSRALGYLGTTTDLHFIEGFMQGVQTRTSAQSYIRECACPFQWEANGYTGMTERNNIDLRDLSTKDFWELGEDDIIFRKVDGVVFKEVGFMAPMTLPDTFLINIAKFKAHQMGLSGAVKNLQGITGKSFHSFCAGHIDVFKTLDKRYHRFFQPDYLTRVRELHEKHMKEGIPRWDSLMDRPPQGGGFFMEQWIQRMLDSYSITPTGINMVEGIYGLDGDGFGSGPHDRLGKNFMSNHVVFGLDAIRVDIINHWLAGHEPGNFGLFHIAIERGLSDILDPFDIPVYLWEDGVAKKTDLNSIKRTPLLTTYLRKNSHGDNEERYHMVNEPFDYSAWKSSGRIVPKEVPSIQALGTDAGNNVVMEVSVPEKGDVYVDILNRHGEVIWRLEADELEPGKHQVVWDGFMQPGLYYMYVKGMDWDAENEMVIYT